MCLWQASLFSAEDLVRIGGADIMLDGVVRCSSQGRTTTDSNTRFSIVAAELMKATEDPGVRHRLAAWSPRGRLGYDRYLGSYPSFWGAGHPGRMLRWGRGGC
ncbi:unnamed protein product [Prunus brigantina]